MVKGPGAADKPLFVADTRLAESELDPRVDLTPLSKSLLDEPWLPTAARAVTTVGAAFPAVPPPLSPRPLPLDPWFPQFSGQTPAAATIRSRLSFYLSPLTDNGRFVAQPTSPALWAALDRLAPQLALTTEEGASALIAQEVKTLIPDRAELAATLEQMGFNGNPPHPSPTAEAFARRVAYDLGGTLRQARSSVLPKVLEGVSNTTVRSLEPSHLRLAMLEALEHNASQFHGYSPRQSQVAYLTRDVADALEKKGFDPKSHARAIEAAVTRTVDDFVESGVKSLVSQGFTETSARASMMVPTLEHVGDTIGRDLAARLPALAKLKSLDTRLFFIEQAKSGFAGLEAGLVKDLRLTPENARAVAREAQPLFDAQAKAQKVPASLVEALQERVHAAKGPASVEQLRAPRAEGGSRLVAPRGAQAEAKVLRWGERFASMIPKPVVDAAVLANEAVEKVIAASPFLAKAAPIVARVIPYVNTPVAALTLYHATQVHKDPEASNAEAFLADAAATLGVAAAGAAYSPVPALGWAASFAGGLASIGVSGLEWGASKLRKSLQGSKEHTA